MNFIQMAEKYGGIIKMSCEMLPFSGNDPGPYGVLIVYREHTGMLFRQLFGQLRCPLKSKVSYAKRDHYRL